MKAKPVALINGEQVEVTPDKATHVVLNFPGPVRLLALPVIIRGTREGTNCWTWNGDTEFPTLRPSISTTNGKYIAHCWLSEGKAQFLSDSTTEYVGQTLDLLEVL